MTENRVTKRIQMIDGLRGLAVVLMVFHHFFYDLVEFMGAPAALFSNPVFDVLHYIFAGLFILLSGVSSRFSRSNLKRGVKVLLVAMAITVVTTFMDMPIRFGILHLLGFCMIFYGLTCKGFESLPPFVLPVLCVLLLPVSAFFVGRIDFGVRFLWMFGWTYPGFYSADYFPILPWVFVFLFGTWAGKYIQEGRLPNWFYDTPFPVFSAIGRKALLIYIVHQPVLYGLTMLLVYFLSPL